MTHCPKSKHPSGKWIPSWKRLAKRLTVWMVPSALIFLSVLSFNYLGDVVRARFDVREGAL